MPRLPDVTEERRPVARPPTNIVEFSPDLSPGVAAGRELRRAGRSVIGAGDTLRRAMEVEQDRLDSERAESTFNRLREQQVDLAYGDEGYLQVKGNDATSRKLYEDYNKRFDEAAARLEEDLANDEQKRKFRERTQVARLQFGEGLLRHVMREGEAAAKQTYNDTMTVEVNAGAASWASEGDVQLSAERIRASVRERGAHMGWSDTQVKAETERHLSALHTAVIEQMVVNDAGAAREYYKAHRKDIAGTARPALERYIREGTVRRSSQESADAIMAGMDARVGDEQWRLATGRALAQARAIDSPEKRDATVKRVQQRINEMEVQRDARREGEANDAWERVLQSGGDLDAVPTTLMSTLRAEQPAVVVALERYAEGRSKGDEPVTEYSRYYELEQLASEQPEAFAKLNLMADRDKLSDKHFDRLSGLQRATKAGLGSARAKAAEDLAEQEKKRATYANVRSTVKDKLEAAGVDTTPTNDKDRERLAKLYDTLFFEVEDLQRIQKGEATQAQIRELADDVLQTITRDPLWGWVPFTGDEVLAFEAEVEDLYERIPPAERTNLEQALGAAGESVTKDNVVRRWNQIKRWQRARERRGGALRPQP